MLEEAKKFTKEHHMIEEGSRVIAECREEPIPYACCSFC